MNQPEMKTSPPWQLFVFAGSAGFFISALILVLSTTPKVIEKPIAIPQEIKPRCIAFCGD